MQAALKKRHSIIRVPFFVVVGLWGDLSIQLPKRESKGYYTLPQRYVGPAYCIFSYFGSYNISKQHYTLTHFCMHEPCLASAAVIDRIERIPQERAQPMLISWAPKYGWLLHHWDLNLRSRVERMPYFLFCCAEAELFFLDQLGLRLLC